MLISQPLATLFQAGRLVQGLLARKQQNNRTQWSLQTPTTHAKPKGPLSFGLRFVEANLWVSLQCQDSKSHRNTSGPFRPHPSVALHESVDHQQGALTPSGSKAPETHKSTHVLQRAPIMSYFEVAILTYSYHLFNSGSGHVSGFLKRSRLPKPSCQVP